MKSMYIQARSIIYTLVKNINFTHDSNGLILGKNRILGSTQLSKATHFNQNLTHKVRHTTKIIPFGLSSKTTCLDNIH